MSGNINPQLLFDMIKAERFLINPGVTKLNYDIEGDRLLDFYNANQRNLNTETIAVILQISSQAFRKNSTNDKRYI